MISVDGWGLLGEGRWVLVDEAERMALLLFGLDIRDKPVKMPLITISIKSGIIKNFFIIC